MPLTIKCLVCNEPIKFHYTWINEIVDTHFATIHCRNPKCKATLYSDEKKGIILLKEKNETLGI
jgi:hypothetical protein